MPRRRSLLALLLAVAVGVALGSGALPVQGLDPAPDTARVVRVVDGDTIAVQVGGRSERVRYIGVDTPETKKPGTPVECYGRRASAENARLVEGERVRLVADAEARDRYGRMLAYVYRVDDGRFVNAELIRGGFAQPLTIPPNVAHAAEFAALARTARREGRGLWGSCGS
jgi:micrococcal nuclease